MNAIKSFHGRSPADDCPIDVLLCAACSVAYRTECNTTTADGAYSQPPPAATTNSNGEPGHRRLAHRHLRGKGAVPSVRMVTEVEGVILAEVPGSAIDSAATRSTFRRGGGRSRPRSAAGAGHAM
jgi:hypothetical protein